MNKLTWLWNAQVQANRFGFRVIKSQASTLASQVIMLREKLAHLRFCHNNHGEPQRYPLPSEEIEVAAGS